MQGLQKCDQRSSSRRAQIASICRHIAAALNHLPDELVLREADCNTIQSRPSLSSGSAEGVAISALLGLKHKRTLALQCCRAMDVSAGHRITTPGIHVWAPRCMLGKPSKCAE